MPKEDERTPGLDDLPDAIDFLSEINAHPGAWCFIYEGEDGDSWTQGSTAPDQAAASVSSLREALAKCIAFIDAACADQRDFPGGVYEPGVTDVELEPNGTFKLSDARAALSAPHTPRLAINRSGKDKL